MSKFTKKAGVESSEGNLVFVRPTDLARAGFTGVVAEGELAGMTPNRYDENKQDFKIVADTEFKVEGVDKEGKKYIKEVNAGDTLIINAAGNLEYLMKSVGIGNLCQISYFGKKEITKGNYKGTLAHTFEVMYE